MSNLTQRVLTALIGAPLVVGVVYLGGWFFGGLMLLVGLLAQREFYGLAEAAGIRPLKSVGLVVGGLLIVRSLVPLAVPLAVLGLIVVLVAELYRRLDGPIPNVTATVFGAIYPALLVGYFVDLRVLGATGGLGDMGAFWLTVVVVVAIWASDTFAYFTGRAFGSHPLFPRISPKKTIEGSVGGVVGAIVVVVAFKLFLVPFLTWGDAAFVGLVCGAFGQLGDLVESLLKRSVGVKDSGHYLPGHGGMLDRIDAMLVAIPVVVLYFDYVRGVW
ncbi:MAG: phosphatidate cytidylyltransferase [Rhodothermales bacterium]